MGDSESPTDQATWTTSSGSTPGPARTNKRERPCDACRKGKRRCYLIGEPGQGCVACKASSTRCTYNEPASKRSRIRAPSPPAHHQVDAPTTSLSSPLAMPPPPVPPQPASLAVSIPPVPTSLSALFSTSGPSSGTSIIAPPPSSLSSLSATPISVARPFVPSLRSNVSNHGAPSSSSSGSATTLAPLDSSTSDLFYSNVDDSSLSSRVRDVGGTQQGERIFFVQQAMGVYKGKKRDDDRGPRLQKVLDLLPGPEWPARLQTTFIEKVLPALPVFDLARLEALPHPPTGLVLGMLGHAAMLHRETRGLFRTIWSEISDLQVESFRHPHLVTLQVAILDFTSRPDVDPAGNTVAIARAVGAAHLMGLHRDCSEWSLPLWEKKLRKRLWWMLVLADRWIALYQGRPHQIHNRTDTWDVGLPTLSDFDLTPTSTAESATSFMAMCAMAELLYSIDSEFFSLRAQAAFRAGRASARRKLGRETRLRLVGSYVLDLKKIETDYGLASVELQPAATGVKCAQLSYLGLTIVLGRLTLEAWDPEDELDRNDIELALGTALGLVEDVIVFCEKLTLSDVSSFWISFSGHHLSNSFSLLIRSLLISRRLSLPAPLSRSTALLARFFAVLLATHAASWEVSERALAKALALLPSVARLCPDQVGALWAGLRGRVWTQLRRSETAEVLLALIPDAALREEEERGRGSADKPASARAGASSGIKTDRDATTAGDLVPPVYLDASTAWLAAAPPPAPPSRQHLSPQPHPHPLLQPQLHRPEGHPLDPTAATDRFSTGLPNFAAPPSSAADEPGGDPFASHADPQGPGAGTGMSAEAFSFESPFQAVMGDEDLWAGLGDIEGSEWMELGFT